MHFIYSLQSEWIKTRRTAASWLVIIGAFFIPAIIIVIRFARADKIPALYKNPTFWQEHYFENWQMMAFLLLPMGIILSTSLITQLEYRNNSWKQLHTTPQLFSTIFFSKLSVIVLMMLQFFILFNLGIYLSAIIPLLFNKNAVYPPQQIPYIPFLKYNAMFFIGCLPVIALQYLLSLKFKNFMVPLGIGIALLVASTFAIQWKYGYTVPYTYCAYAYLQLGNTNTKAVMPVNIQLLSAIVAVAFIGAGYLLYISKKDKC